MNKAIKKCCICRNSETGEFIMIAGDKYHLLCIEKMAQEKQELINYLKDQIKENEHKLNMLHWGLDIVHTRSSIITCKEILSKIEKR